MHAHLPRHQPAAAAAAQQQQRAVICSDAAEQAQLHVSAGLIEDNYTPGPSSITRTGPSTGACILGTLLSQHA